MPSAEFTLNLADLPSVRELIIAAIAIDDVMMRSYDPEDYAPEYKVFHDALKPFRRKAT